VTSTYRKKPIPVRALQLTADSYREIFDSLTPEEFAAGGENTNGTVFVEVRSLEGVMHASEGDWIVRDPHSHVWVVRGSIFAETYEPVYAEEASAEERIARRLAADDYLMPDEEPDDAWWNNRPAKFREDYLSHARHVIALVRAEDELAATPAADRAAVPVVGVAADTTPADTRDEEIALLRLTLNAVEEGRRELRGELARIRARMWTLTAMLEGLHTLLATSSRDWQTYRVDAWLWAVLVGWDCEQPVHDETCTHGAMEETAAMHGWDAATVAKARRYRALVHVLTGPVVPAQPGNDTKTPEARPRCPHCQMPHDLTPGSLPVTACQNIRQRIADA
jgi:hypothetical protein